MKTFYVVRHPHLDKKHPLGEEAPLTEKGQEQCKKLAEVFKSKGVGLVVVAAEDIPRFNDTATEMERAGIEVRRADGICFKDMKGHFPIREIAANYRKGGEVLMAELEADETTPDTIGIVGSWPLITGLSTDPATATDEVFETKPDFCTGIVVEMDIEEFRVINADFRPLE